MGVTSVRIIRVDYLNKCFILKLKQCLRGTGMGFYVTCMYGKNLCGSVRMFCMKDMKKSGLMEIVFKEI